MHIKATIVAYAFSVQCFENATIVAYAGLRVKLLNLIIPHICIFAIVHSSFLTETHVAYFNPI